MQPEPSSQIFLARLSQFKSIMLSSLPLQLNKNLSAQLKSKLQKIIIIHTLNDYYNLKSIDQNDIQVIFDRNWCENKQGIWKLKYLKKKQSQQRKQHINQNQQILLIRIIQQNNDKLKVNLNVKGSEIFDSYVVQNNDDLHQIVKKHSQAIKKVFSREKQHENKYFPSFMRSIPLKPGKNDRPGYNPPAFLPPEKQPFNNPFGQQQYVGPNSRIFGDRPNNPGFEGPNPMQRYDPVDPFDEGHPKEPFDEFIGFDKFGIPLKRPQVPKGSPLFPDTNGKRPRNWQ